jgi:metallo-beta-lactamase family protein
MKIKFFGAAKCVTGSCYYIETQNANFLVDCGMRQGSDTKKALTTEDFPFDEKSVDFVLLTHAHIDHSGYLPMLVKNGFAGRIITTSATRELNTIMLPDSGHIQEMDVFWKNKKLLRKGKKPIEPKYTVEDALVCIEHIEGVDYGDTINVTDDIKARFNDAGHLLGSASIEIWVTENGKQQKLVFSGDIGNKDKPIIKDPTYLDAADIVVMESTYGDRQHRETKDPADQLRDVLRDAIARGGNIVVPSFAIGRTQEVLYDISKFLEDGSVPGLERMPVYIDSPLGIRATQIFEECYLNYYDKEAMQLKKKGVEFLDFKTLNVAMTPDESKAINFLENSAIIISSSGMCDAGRIKHHLKHNIWKDDATIIFVGYQAYGTTGRRILDGAEKIRIFGDEIKVAAKIARVEGFSGHADKDDLIQWVDEFDQKPQKVIVTHGEEQVAMAFGQTLSDKGYNVIVPSLGQVYDTQSDVGLQTDFKVIDFARKPKKHGDLKRKMEAISKHVAADEAKADEILLEMQKVLDKFSIKE